MEIKMINVRALGQGVYFGDFSIDDRLYLHHIAVIRDNRLAYFGKAQWKHTLQMIPEVLPCQS